MLKKVTGNMPIPFLCQGEGCRIALRIIRSGKSTYCVVIVVDNRYIVPFFRKNFGILLSVGDENGTFLVFVVYRQ